MYKIVSDDRLEGLEAKVNDLMGLGYELVGNPFLTGGTICDYDENGRLIADIPVIGQAMIRKTHRQKQLDLSKLRRQTGDQSSKD